MPSSVNSKHLNNSIIYWIVLLWCSCIHLPFIQAQSPKTQDSLAIVKLVKRADYLKTRSDYVGAASVRTKGAILAQKGGWNQWYIRLNKEIAHDYLLGNQLDRADQQLQQLLQDIRVFDEVPKREKIMVEYYLGQLKSRRGAPEEGIKIYQAGVAAAYAIQDSTLAFQGLTGLGLSYFLNGDFDEAIEVFQEKEQICLAQNREDYLVHLYSNWSAIYGELGKGEEAVACLERALIILKKVSPNNWIELESLYTNLAIRYLDVAQPYKALEYLELSKGIIHERFDDDPTSLLFLLGVESNVWYDLQDYEKSLRIQEQEIKLREQQSLTNQDQRKLHEAYLDAAYMYRALHRYAEADASLEKLLSIGKPMPLMLAQGYMEKM